ncbi:extensin [Cajanus cajan]|uniref:Uncharacterized protein n=1 Tax=Cajanus cajan TaxID=3821 RepID=A0A151SDB0_CAJCA|nr:extensin [Cajanus cajan]KYP52814.1 hypothetical protein KK1_025349 [Cajanus cajan]
MILNLILVLFCVTTPIIKGEESRKLDATNGDVKCGSCEGGYTPSPPPPTIEYLSPPPPSPLPPPPPSPKKPSSKYCPPPPSSAYMYLTGPPGNLYPVDENFSGASPSRHQSFSLFLPLLVATVLLISLARN